MNRDRWNRIQQLFYAASDMAPGKRDVFLDVECADDPGLRAEIESLLLSGEDHRATGISDSLRLVAASAISTAPGERIGNYELIRELGHGGMGVVFLAVRADDQYRKQVAIKLMNVAMARPEMQMRFRAERQILADLDHPNIARLLDGGSTPSGLPYVVMEYVDGVPIDVYCRERNLSVRQRLTLFRELCEALIYAHRNLVVHRDIKPANVLVGADGSPKLLDFGVAKLVGNEAETLTQASDRMLTPRYASPEQIRGEAITTASDVYSLGVLLHELLTGRIPSPGHPPELDADLSNVLLMAIREEPSRRYNSADQFSDDIRRCLEGFPVIARKDTWQYRAGKFVNRHRWSVGAAAVFVLVLIVFGAGMALLAKRVSVERDNANIERRNAEQVSQFLIDSFRLADRSGTQGRTLTAQEVLDRGSDRIFRQLAEQPAIRARMMNTMGEVYESLGLYDRAQSLLSKALEVDPTVEILSSLGKLAETKGDFAQAVNWYRKALAQEHRPAETAALQAELGSALTDSANFADAERLLNESLNTRRKLFGNDSVPVADSLNRFGELRGSQPKYKEAEPYYRQSLAIRRRLLGPENPDTAGTIASLALVLYSLARAPEAESLQREALSIHRKLYGDSHILVAGDLDLLASMRYSAGDMGQALDLDRQAVAIYQVALGPESSQLGLLLVQIGNTLDRTGKLADAERETRKGLAMDVKLLGENSPPTMVAENNLAKVLHDEGKNAEAEKIMTPLIEKQRRIDTGGSRLAGSLMMSGTIRSSLGDFRGAGRNYDEAIGLFLRNFGEKHPNYGRALSVRALNMILQGELKKPEEMLHRSLTILRNSGRRDPYDLSYPLVTLAKDLLLQGRASEAEAPAREGFDLRRKIMAADDARYAESESVLGGCLAALHRYDEAAPLLTESHKSLLKFRGDRSLAAELRRLDDFNRSRQ